MRVKSILKLKHLLWATGAVVLLVAFNNCGEGFVVQNLGSISGGSVLFSRAPGESCEDALVKVYANTYHPFLSQTCNSCHINGPGLGVFASSDLATSYTSFSSIGAEKISSQAVNDSHKPPYTGSQNTARITELKSYWAAAQTAYAECSSAAVGGSGGSFVVKSTNKQVAANLATTFTRMEWDLETQSNGKVPLIAGIEIRRAVFSGVTQGYEFRNPTLRLKNTTAGNYQARALNVYINNALQSEVTTYSNIDQVISTTTDVNLSAGTANALAVMTPATTDMIAIEWQKLGSTTGAPNPGGGTAPTPTPAATPTPIGAVTYAQLAANGGLFATYCFNCHRGANASGSLDMTVYNNARLAAQNIKSRVNNPNNPMPTGGLLQQAQRDMISAWVDQGAPQ
jgi:hypothetical protein